MKISTLTLTAALLGIFLLNAYASAAEADYSVLTQVGKGQFTVEKLIDKDDELKEYENINTLGCDKIGWGAMPSHKIDERVKKGMSVCSYIEHKADDGHRAGAYCTTIDSVRSIDDDITVEKTSTALLTKNFDIAAPMFNRAPHNFPKMGDSSKTICKSTWCQSMNDINMWSIVNEVGHANSKGERCGLKDSTSDITSTIERGTYTFADGKKVAAYRFTSRTRYPIYCGQNNMEPGEDVDVKIVTNDLPAVESLNWHCGGVTVFRSTKLTGRNTGKVYSERKNEIIQQK